MEGPSVLRTRRTLLTVSLAWLAAPPTRWGSPRAGAAPDLAEELVAVQVADLAPPLFLAIAQVVVPPGATIDAGTTTGSRLLVVESGTLTVSAAVDGVGVGLGRAVVAHPTAHDRVLAPGDRLGLAAGEIDRLRNDGARPTVFLDAALLPAAARPDDGAFTTDDGVSFQLLAGAVVDAAPSGPVVVRLRRLRLAGGQGMPTPPVAGLALVYVESGRLRLVPAGAGVQYSRAAAATPYSAAGPMRPVAAGSAVDLTAGGAALLPGAAASESRNPRSSASTLLVVEVRPVAESGARPAAIPVR